MTEVKEVNSKERVLKIMGKRQEYIDSLYKLAHSDEIIISSRSELHDKFMNWLVENKIIKKSTSKLVERQPNTRQEKKEAKQEVKKEVKKEEKTSDAPAPVVEPQVASSKRRKILSCNFFYFTDLVLKSSSTKQRGVDQICK